ncbi:hypothetical protein DFQ28_005777 [Apophysomyces sp. BC1034]|nr:hypothetical protein DFQ29_002465 [Apophysomyces sp. BC1021]KAG0187848.1 hypothetical protein DFQ28_005777 [Apophysomyces sp. BC1034]
MWRRGTRSSTVNRECAAEGAEVDDDECCWLVAKSRESESTKAIDESSRLKDSSTGPCSLIEDEADARLLVLIRVGDGDLDKVVTVDAGDGGNDVENKAIADEEELEEDEEMLEA